MIGLLILCLCHIPSGSAKALVPESFVVPVEALLSDYRLLKVDPQFALMDYQALMSARVFIRSSLATSWPEDDFTLDKNSESLRQDLIAFEQRRTFTFHIFHRASNRLIGCLYITAPFTAEHDAAVFAWVQHDYLSSPVFSEIQQHIQRWVRDTWPFDRVDYSLNVTR